jgi:hypothetical protein
MLTIHQCVRVYVTPTVCVQLWSGVLMSLEVLLDTACTWTNRKSALTFCMFCSYKLSLHLIFKHTVVPSTIKSYTFLTMFQKVHGINRATLMPVIQNMHSTLLFSVVVPN